MGNDQPQSVLGALIRQQREVARLSMRQLSEAAGISNPYLSQIERGLRFPSETVLDAIATSLDTSTDELIRRAGFVERPDDDPPDLTLEDAIQAASELTAAQRRAMSEIYRGFVDANLIRRTRN
ncbi:helix-turn-helix domain-containing protein [Tsukamurella asaccharolytica]|uniref:Helix-turn-helix domain-containing protein n=1 Tax=Tsukamurella asaccharolytica TaxID=2592067 RepID=A0A5C5RH03_9ACTN|nr:helix-turn-helix domain-containing protein [Tsukamurella asaccharolytica]TWS21365.1 helix-turn-helix domain-containing protein [Tsukamurella asaccharolytica]